MNKKIIAIAGGSLGLLAISYLGATWWAGKSAEEALNKQHQLLADLPYFVIKKREYERGFFSSTERTTIALNPKMLKPYQMLTLANQTGLDKLEVSYVQTIKHGPFPLLTSGDFSPLKAAVSTDITFSPETKKQLAQFFGEQKPLQIDNRIHFNNDGEFKIKVPSFTHEEALSKVKVIWQGLDAKLAYGKDYSQVKVEMQAPGLRLEAGPKGVFEFKQLAFNANNARSSFGIMLGEGKLTLAEATFQQTEGRQIDAKLTQLDYLVKTAAQGEFVNSSADLAVKTLLLNGKSYGPAKLAVEANHLHGPTLGKLSRALDKLQRDVPESAEQASKMLDLLSKEGLPLLKNDPELAIKQLSIKLPEGEINLKANLGLKGFADEDIKQPIKLLEKMHAHADLRVPKSVIETYVLWQARSMIATDTAEGEQPDASDLDNLARNLMENQIEKLTEQKLIRVEGNYLASTADWKQGRLLVNGTPVPLPWQVKPVEAEQAAEAAAQ